jgi:aminobenzoyl-glutamate utilization protein B
VSWVVPTATLRYPANIPNLPGHHWSNAMAMATPIAHKGIVAGSKVMAMTVLDLILRPELIAQAKDYFENVQLKKNRYMPLLPESAQPQIHMNREIMARYRPQMTKFYYDASRYDTYLEQLGVKYPQLVKP